jgi:hypothetical protein
VARVSLPHFFLAIALSAAPLLGQDEDPQPLLSGVEFQGHIGPDLLEVQTFTVDVGPKVVALRIELTSPEEELALWGSPPAFPSSADSYEEGGDWTDEDVSFIETLNDMPPWVMLVDRFTEPAIEAGTYSFEVQLFGITTPTEPTPFAIKAELFSHSTPTPLPLEEVTHGVVQQSSGCFHTYSIEVPKGAQSLRIDLFGADDGLVLLTKRKRPPVRLNGAVAQVSHGRGRKTLLLGEDTQPKLRPGTWILDVADPMNAERPAAYKLHASVDGKIPEELLLIPTLPLRHGPGPLGESLAAVVELSMDDGGGSGTFISEDGRILTNAHVVSRPDGTARQGAIYVACTLDPRRPPVELFKARVTHFDFNRDLAILELVEGYYNQTLPLDLKTPSPAFAPAGSAAITDPLWVVGHPWTGGFGSRVPLSVTRGIVAGFDWIAAGPVLRTDAEIAGGNSGGAAFDSEGRLVGVPTATIGTGAEKMGYLHPVELIPASWLQR